jgi:hypothetical protein
MTFDVDTKSVEAPRDTWHWDRPHKLERRGRFRFSIDREKHNKCEQYRQALFHLQVSRLNSSAVKLPPNPNDSVPNDSCPKLVRIRQIEADDYVL